MALYRYKAKTMSGETVVGKYDGRDRDSVHSMLKSKGVYPLDIKLLERGDKEVSLKVVKKISMKDMSIFCRQFQVMLDAGLTILGCIDLLRRQTENKSLVYIINKIYEDLQKGTGLSDAIKRHEQVLPNIMVNMVEAGEVSGNLDITMKRLALHFDKENKIKSKIKTAMMYPLTISCISCVMVIFMLTFIVPKFVGMFIQMKMELPLPTKVLYIMGTTITSWQFLVLAPIVILIIRFLFKKFMNSETGKRGYANFLINAPLIGKNYRKILASRFTRTLSLLLRTGVPLIQALEVVDRVVDNHLISRGMVKVRDEIKRGSNLSGPLENLEIFPAMVTQMISIGEEAGSLDSIIETVADFYDEELDSSISRIVSMLEPLMIFALALVIGGIVIAMILPVFGMYQGVGK